MSRTRRAVLCAAATAGAFALAGCQGDDGGDGETPTQASTPAPTAPSGPTETVTMFDSSFTPSELEIEQGTTVVWENGDSYAHTVTAASENWEFDVEVPAEGEASHTFERAGLYDVYCRFHGRRDLTGMSMRIAVGDATIPADG